MPRADALLDAPPSDLFYDHGPVLVSSLKHQPIDGFRGKNTNEG